MNKIVCTDISIKDIAKNLNTTINKIYKINSGVTWHSDKLNYPIRQSNSK